MRQESPDSNHFPPIYLRMGLLVVLMTSGTIIFYCVSWIYHKIYNQFGIEIAEVVVAFLMVMVVILILFGFGAGLGADQIVRRRKIQALWIYRLLKRCKVMRSLWRYIKPNGQMESARLPAVETISIPERPPRRGRRPTYSLDRWVRVVQAWENRDTQRNTMTLSEYLAEQFGTYADGSPQMSGNSYYEWRKKVFMELRKQESRKKEKTTA
jgi:hypothetical protein